MTILFCVQILTLTQPIEFSWKIRPVCLPSNPSVTYENQVAQATGWGRTDDNSLSANLMEVDVRVISIQTCQNSYPGVMRYVHMYIHMYIQIK